jgi:outer membrane protein assembly factor BamE (lipoprotein component of BamABCDE complex)
MAANPKLMNPNELQSLIVGKNRSEVINILGNPDESSEYNDYYDAENKIVSRWIYRNRIEYFGADLQLKRHDVSIYLDDEIVDLVEFE